eukprot:TRINITY_DN2455_c0_g1_i5.p1 TRINITY_DN2455_c0_g1~~TRINITY_DN2455_c0_g1_i5.p1  ORF type:complete len:126 (+),score=38.20 TRINITY_DN2455_c0_g1_i5:175-552(+)
MNQELDQVSESNEEEKEILPMIRPLLIQQNESEKIDRLKSFLSKNIRITISDGRIFTGSFLCVDSHRNFVIGSAEETQIRILSDETKKENKRTVGVVTIPGKHILKIESQSSNQSITPPLSLPSN